MAQEYYLMNLILKKREFDEVPNLLIEYAPLFRQSDEFKNLDAEDRLVSGLVCAAFTKYFVHIQQQVILQTDVNESKRAELENCYVAIERLASSNDPTVNNLVVVEIFENICEPDTMLIEMKKRLKPKSLDLYKRWIIK